MCPGHTVETSYLSHPPSSPDSTAQIMRNRKIRLDAAEEMTQNTIDEYEVLLEEQQKLLNEKMNSKWESLLNEERSEHEKTLIETVQALKETQEARYAEFMAELEALRQQSTFFEQCAFDRGVFRWSALGAKMMVRELRMQLHFARFARCSKEKMKAFAEMLYRRTRGGKLKIWRAWAANQKKIYGGFEIARLVWIRGRLSRGWNRWIHATVDAHMADSRYKALKSWINKALRMGLNTWQARYKTIKHEQDLVQRALLRMMKRKLSMAFQKWKLEAAAIAREKYMLLGALTRMPTLTLILTLIYATRCLDEDAEAPVVDGV